MFKKDLLQNNASSLPAAALVSGKPVRNDFWSWAPPFISAGGGTTCWRHRRGTPPENRRPDPQPPCDVRDAAAVEEMIDTIWKDVRSTFL